MYATFVAADLHSKARCKLAYGSALISRGPRCMQACSGELRSAIRSVIEQCTASHVSIVASKRRVGHILSYLMEQYFLCFFLYLPKGIYLCLFTTSRPRLRHTRNIKYAHTHNSKSNFFIRKCSLNLRISKKCSIFAPNLQVAWK